MNLFNNKRLQDLTQQFHLSRPVFLFVILLGIFVPYNAKTQGIDEIHYGIELTFTNEELKRASTMAGFDVANTVESETAQRNLIENLMARCPQCQLQMREDRYGISYGRIIYPDSFLLNITLDPAVIEVTSEAIPESQLETVAARLDQDLFSAAREVDLRPSYSTGGGHLHISAHSFFELDSINGGAYFRDFMVDMYNHPIILNEILSHSHDNAPALRHLSWRSRQNFERIIKNFDLSPINARELAQEIYHKVYTQNPAGLTPAQKYQAINISRIVEEQFQESQRTVEIRALRPQQNADNLILIARLFKHRMEFLKSRRHQGEHVVIDTMTDYHMESDIKIERFVRFVEESGLRPQDYLRLVGENLLDSAWEYLERTYPDQLDIRYTFLHQLAQDSSFDSTYRAQFVLEKLEQIEEVRTIHINTLETLRQRHLNQDRVIKKIERLLDSHLWSGIDISTQATLSGQGCHELMAPFVRNF